MKTKSIGLLIFFIFVHYIAYNYIKHKHSIKVNTTIEYMVPPITYEDYFVFKDLNKFFGNMFSQNVQELNLIKSDNLS